MTRPIDAKTQAGAGKPSSGNSATTAQDRARTARGVRAARVVLSTMWGHAAGKFSLIVLGLWLASSAVSLVWTPYSLWSTDGYHVWAKPSRDHWLGTDGTGADVFSWLLAGSRTNLLIVVLTVAVAAVFGLAIVALMVSRHAALSAVSVVVVDALNPINQR